MIRLSRSVVVTTAYPLVASRSPDAECLSWLNLIVRCRVAENTRSYSLSICRRPGIPGESSWLKAPMDPDSKALLNRTTTSSASVERTFDAISILSITTGTRGELVAVIPEVPETGLVEALAGGAGVGCTSGARVTAAGSGCTARRDGGSLAMSEFVGARLVAATTGGLDDISTLFDDSCVVTVGRGCATTCDSSNGLGATSDIVAFCVARRFSGVDFATAVTGLSVLTLGALAEKVESVKAGVVSRELTVGEESGVGRVSTSRCGSLFAEIESNAQPIGTSNTVASQSRLRLARSAFAQPNRRLLLALDVLRRDLVSIGRLADGIGVSARTETVPSSSAA